jgi:hypothetical protein
MTSGHLLLASVPLSNAELTRAFEVIAKIF